MLYICRDETVRDAEAGGAGGETLSSPLADSDSHIAKPANGKEAQEETSDTRKLKAQATPGVHGELTATAIAAPQGQRQADASPVGQGQAGEFGLTRARGLSMSAWRHKYCYTRLFCWHALRTKLCARDVQG